MVLEVFYKLLRDYEPQLEDFADQYVELQGYLIHSFAVKQDYYFYSVSLPLCCDFITFYKQVGSMLR